MKRYLHRICKTALILLLTWSGLCLLNCMGRTFGIIGNKAANPFLSLVNKVYAQPAVEGVTDSGREAAEEVIKIYSVADLLEFAANCTLDAWSEHVSVELHADLDLEDSGFQPIPVFSGTFDGKGHSIAGLKVIDSISPAGLFGVVQTGAVIKNITVIGEIAPSGEAAMVGGIAGENYGHITNCTFIGTVSGKHQVGGIAGFHGYTGIITNCRTEGDLTGETMSGGIAGYNQGMLVKCKNDMSVNGKSADISMYSEEMELTLSKDMLPADMAQLGNRSLLPMTTDMGGIAGYSTGVLEACSNEGIIGYPHVGYNVGGIVGRSCGYVKSCRNEGQVYGRRDVGGIVGQMEPYILVKLSESAIAEIQRELDALNALLDTAESHADNSAYKLRKNINEIREYSKKIEENIQKAEEASEAPETDSGGGIEGAISSADAYLKNLELTELMSKLYLMSGKLETMGNQVTGDINTLSKDLNKITRQSAKLSETLERLQAEAEATTLSDYLSDTSDLQLETATYGKVTDCVQTGTVYGDVHVGGIAGYISLEEELDPEDDVTVELSLAERRQYELMAILHRCVNQGVVTAKKDYVGGIAGRMDLGVAAHCENYGSVTSENGDYVGGIAGLVSSKVRSCFAKCSLSGRNYVGGIVGSGITETATGESSLVSQCYALPDVQKYTQFAGAIAGVKAGAYLDCGFVAENMTAINRTNYLGQAEELAYEELLEVDGLPEAFESFTLTFMAGDAVIYTTEFSYGDSFNAEDFPPLPGMAGYNVWWDTAELKNLQKDTIVQAIYAPYLAVADSEAIRGEHRPVFLIEGQFHDGADVTMEKCPITYEPERPKWRTYFETVKVTEQWRITLPQDGLLIHNVRYLPAEEGTPEIYVKQDGQWEQALTEPVGSYLLIQMAGTEAEIAVVKTSSQWKLWIPGMIVLVLMMGGSVWMIKKKKNILKYMIWMLAAVILVLAALVVYYLFAGKLGNSLEAYGILQRYIEQPKQAMELHLRAKLGEKELDVETKVYRTELEARFVTCIEQSGIRFYYADGILFLENGKAYGSSEISADYAKLLEQTALLYEYVDLEAEKEGDMKKYRIRVQEEGRNKLVEYLLPSLEKGLEPQVSEVELFSEKENLTGISFVSEGIWNEAVNSKMRYRLEVDVTPLDPEENAIAIPGQVQTAILSDKTQIQEIITEDVFRLYVAGEKLFSADPLGMEISLKADCGPLSLSEQVTFLSKEFLTKAGEEICVNCLQKNDFSVYFTEDVICSEQGYAVTTKKAQAVELAGLPRIAYELFLNGTFQSIESEGMYLYSLSLDEEAMKEIARAIAPESEDMAIRFENGSICIRIKDGAAESMLFSLDGSMDVILTEVPVAFSAELDVSDMEQYADFTIPEKVLEAVEK